MRWSAHAACINGLRNSVSRGRPKYRWKDMIGSLPKFILEFRVTLRLAFYRQSVYLGDKPLETHDQ
jgi:hypothetical protein